MAAASATPATEGCLVQRGKDRCWIASEGFGQSSRSLSFPKSLSRTLSTAGSGEKPVKQTGGLFFFLPSKCLILMQILTDFN